MQRSLASPSGRWAVRLIAVSILASAGIPIRLQSVPAAVTYMVPSSIPGDCSQDVTAALSSFFASVPNGGTATLSAGACYRVDGSLTLTNKSSYTFDGNGATIRAFTYGAAARHHIKFDGGSNVTIHNLTIHGGDTSPGTYDSNVAFQHGVSLHRVQGARLLNLTIRNVNGDFIYVGPHNTTARTRDVLIQGGAYKGAGRQGIAIVNGERVTIDSNRVELIGNSVFDFEGNASVGDIIRDIKITNNTVGAHRHLFLPNDHAPGGVNVLIANNSVLNTGSFPTGPGSGWPTVHANAGGSNWIVRNNDFHRFEGKAFWFNMVSGVTVTCNRVKWVSGTGPGVSTATSTSVRITDNRFVGASSAYTSTASDVIATGNALTDTAFPSSCGPIGPQATSPTPSPSPTATATPTSSPTPTPTTSPTPSPSPTATPSPTPLDVTPPTVPAALKGSLIKRVVTLSWGVSTDDVGVAGYRVYRDGTLVGTTTSLSYTDRPLWKLTHTYSVRAYDARGNLSGPATVTMSILRFR